MDSPRRFLRSGFSSNIFPWATVSHPKVFSHRTQQFFLRQPQFLMLGPQDLWRYSSPINGFGFKMSSKNESLVIFKKLAQLCQQWLSNVNDTTESMALLGHNGHSHGTTLYAKFNFHKLIGVNDTAELWLSSGDGNCTAAVIYQFSSCSISSSLALLGYTKNIIFTDLGCQWHCWASQYLSGVFGELNG